MQLVRKWDLVDNGAIGREAEASIPQHSVPGSVYTSYNINILIQGNADLSVQEEGLGFAYLVTGDYHPK